MGRIEMTFSHLSLVDTYKEACHIVIDQQQIHHVLEQLLLGAVDLPLHQGQVNQLTTGGEGSLEGIFITI